jgi:hypothetical protein
MAQQRFGSSSRNSDRDHSRHRRLIRVALLSTMASLIALASLGFPNDPVAGAKTLDAKPSVAEIASALRDVAPINSSPDGGIVGIAPFRLFDTRSGSGTGDGVGAGAGRVAAGATVEVPTSGRGGIATDATGVVLNVAAVDASGDGYLTIWPCGTTQPNASNLNFVSGQTIANAAVTVAGTAKTCVFASAPTHLLVDVTAYYKPGAGFVALTPFRLTDTRSGSGTGDGRDAGAGKIISTKPHEIKTSGRGGVSDDAGAVVLNVTVTDPEDSGYVTVWPCGKPQPNASTLNFVRGQTIANAVITNPGANGKTCVYSSAKTNLIADVTGSFATTSFTGLIPFRLADTRPGSATGDAVAASTGRIQADQVLPVPVASRGGVPSRVAAAVLNVTVVDPAGAGYITVWPCGLDRPNASTANFAAGQTIANMAISALGTNGKVCVYSSVAAHLVVDVNGFEAIFGTTAQLQPNVIAPETSAVTHYVSAVAGLATIDVLTTSAPAGTAAVIVPATSTSLSWIGVVTNRSIVGDKTRFTLRPGALTDAYKELVVKGPSELTPFNVNGAITTLSAPTNLPLSQSIVNGPASRRQNVAAANTPTNGSVVSSENNVEFSFTLTNSADKPAANNTSDAFDCTGPKSSAATPPSLVLTFGIEQIQQAGPNINIGDGNIDWKFSGRKYIKIDDPHGFAATCTLSDSFLKVLTAHIPVGPPPLFIAISPFADAAASLSFTISAKIRSRLHRRRFPNA